jgi:hypothetical protein
MKRPIKIIQYKDGTWGAKKKGLFGWKYLNEIYDGFYVWHYSWCYHVPDGYGVYDKFENKQDVITQLKSYYHGHRLLKEA